MIRKRYDHSGAIILTMEYQITPYLIPLIIIGISSLYIIYRLHRNFNDLDIRWVGIILMSGVVWNIGYAAELSFIDIQLMKLLDKIQFIGIFFAPSAFLFYSFYYVNYEKTSVIIPPIVAINLILLVIVFTNDYHHLIWSQAEISKVGSYVFLEQSYGLGMRLIALYAFLQILLSFLILMRSFGKTSGNQTNETILLMLVTLLPIGFAFKTVFGESSSPFEPTSMAMGISGIIAGSHLSSLRKGDLIASTRKVVLDNIFIPILMLDDEKNIVNLNSTAKQIFEAGNQSILNRNLQDFWPDLGLLLEADDFSAQEKTRVIYFSNGESHSFEVYLSRIYLAQNRAYGYVVALHDVTQLEQKSSELETMLEINRAVTSALELNEIMAVIAVQIAEAIKASGCTISIWDKIADSVLTMAEYRRDQNDGDVPGTAYPLNEYPATRKVLDENIVYSVGISDPSVDQAEVALMKELGVASLLILPLRTSEDVLGIIELDHTDYERKFSTEELNLCYAIANQASIALDKAMRFEKTQKQLVAQIALQEASSIISSALDTHTILTRLAEQMCRATDATSAYILEVKDGNSKSTVIAEYFSENASETEKISDLGVEYTNLGGDSEFYDILRSGGHDYAHYDDEDISLGDIESFQKFGGKSVLFIPLIVKDQLIGFTELWESRQRRVFTQEEIDWCHAISRQAAIALEHARLYEQAKIEISERKRVQKQLEHNAFHDSLTNLPNRALLIDRIEQASQRANRRADYHFALVFLDLDDFKMVNDSLGHLIGDELLIQVAKRLEQCTRQIDTSSRFGGDEFAILMEEVQSVQDVVVLVKRILEELSYPHQVRSHELSIMASIGIVMSSPEYSDPIAYLRDGDIAMYRAKSMGKARYVIFDQNMRDDLNYRMKLEQDLRNSVERKDFLVYYQPIFSIPDQIILGFEALIRWDHPQRGILMPSEFISLAEEAGLIGEMSNDLVREACQQVNLWNQQINERPPYFLNVNISSKQLSHPDFLPDITHIISDTGFPGELLNLEITESLIIQDFDVSKKLISKIKEMGINIHLDDFGTGYSALNY